MEPGGEGIYLGGGGAKTSTTKGEPGRGVFVKKTPFIRKKTCEGGHISFLPQGGETNTKGRGKKTSAGKEKKQSISPFGKKRH